MNEKRVWFAAVVAALSACAGRMGGGRPLSHGPDMPAAEGSVKIQAIQGGGASVSVRVKNLREPEELRPPGYAYVAWVQDGREAPPRNLGCLSVGDDLSGELRAVMESDCSDLFVTVEAIADAERPTGRRLLWARCD